MYLCIDLQEGVVMTSFRSSYYSEPCYSISAKQLALALHCKLFKIITKMVHAHRFGPGLQLAPRVLFQEVFGSRQAACSRQQAL